MFTVYVYYANGYVDRLGPFDDYSQALFVSTTARSSCVVVDVEIESA